MAKVRVAIDFGVHVPIRKVSPVNIIAFKSTASAVICFLTVSFVLVSSSGFERCIGLSSLLCAQEKQAAAWRKHSQAMRTKQEWPSDYAPWTSLQHARVAKTLPERHKDLLNLAWAARCKSLCKAGRKVAPDCIDIRSGYFLRHRQ